MGLSSFAPRPVLDFLVLFLEVSCERWSITTPVRFSRNRDPVIIWLVFGKLLEPDLGEVPERSCRVLSTACSEVGILAGVGADIEAVVLGRNRAIAEVYYLKVASV